MRTLNGLPVFEDTIIDEACGMLRISLVDLPAVESDFQKFGKRTLVQMADEEKRLIVGCVMRAGFPIYRRDEERGEYYTVFSAATIRQMAEKYLDENRQNRVNLMHCGEEVRGVNMVQLFIKDSAKGISPAGFEDIEEGSLFCEFHVEDDSIWGWIKEGILRGFSLEGVFFLDETENQEDMKFNYKKMKAALARIVAKFAQITTDKGVLTCEDEPEVGKDVYLLNEDGEVVDAEDGEYKTEDGRTIVVAEGKIAEIREAEGAIEEPAEVEAAEESDTEIADDVDIHNLAAEVDRIKEELEHKKEEIADLKDRVAALEGAAEKTEEAMKKMTAPTAAEEVRGEGKSAPKFRNAHEKMLYELNRAI